MTTPHRILAHRIIWGDRTFSMSVASALRTPDGTWAVEITPFTGETPQTVFVSGAVAIEDADGNPFRNGDIRPPVFRH